MPKLENARIHWLESGQPYSEKFGDIYASNSGGAEESEYVFLRANNLAQRWQKLNCSNSVFTVAELGFGTGLNFLLTWRLWKDRQPAGQILNYLAFERHPLTKADLVRALSKWPQLQPLVEEFTRQYLDHSLGIHRLCFKDVNLDLYFGDATEMLQNCPENNSNQINCWFMDGFAPQKNPSMWQQELLQLMHQHSANCATLSTYSAAGQVKRDLQSVGFNVAKQPGFGRKREMLVAQKTHEPGVTGIGNPISRSPWFSVPATLSSKRSAIVIGAGLAGCSTAYSLSRRGWRVTLVDQGHEIASGASGNKQAILQLRLAANYTAGARFYLQAFLFARRQILALEKLHGVNWHDCGILKLRKQLQKESDNEVDEENPRPADDRLSKMIDYYNDQVLTLLNAEEASQLAGVELAAGALWLPLGGWLNPKKLCSAYLNSPAHHPVEIVTNTSVVGLHLEPEGWLLDTQGCNLPPSEVVVLANSSACNHFEQTAFLPLISVKGQVSQINATELSSKLASVVVGDRFTCPASEGSHFIGASYDSSTSSHVARAENDQENLAGARTAFSRPDFLSSKVTGTRVSTRCNATDFYPVVGALPNHLDFERDFALLQRNAKAQLKRQSNYLPGLFINVGHGSYGLTTCPLSGEFLASLINNESLPLLKATMDSLSPARFIIRNLKRQRSSTSV